MQTAAEDIIQLGRIFDEVLNEVSSIVCIWCLSKQFLNKRPRKTKACFVEIFERKAFSGPKKQFYVTVFLSTMDILSCQLINRFEGMKSG